MHALFPATEDPATGSATNGLAGTERFRAKLRNSREAHGLRQSVLDRFRCGLTLDPARHRDIQRLATLTDEVWWNGFLEKALRERELTLSGRWSTRLTSSAGNATVRNGHALIQISLFIVRETDRQGRWPVRIQAWTAPTPPCSRN